MKFSILELFQFSALKKKNKDCDFRALCENQSNCVLYQPKVAFASFVFTNILQKSLYHTNILRFTTKKLLWTLFGFIREHSFTCILYDVSVLNIKAFGCSGFLSKLQTNFKQGVLFLQRRHGPQKENRLFQVSPESKYEINWEINYDKRKTACDTKSGFSATPKNDHIWLVKPSWSKPPWPWTLFLLLCYSEIPILNTQPLTLVLVHHCLRTPVFIQIQGTPNIWKRSLFCRLLSRPDSKRGSIWIYRFYITVVSWTKNVIYWWRWWEMLFHLMFLIHFFVISVAC